MIPENAHKFEAVRKLGLPLGQYAITGSGAIGIRNLRLIGDIDIIVTQVLWDALAEKYGVVDENGVRKIVFPDGIVEALYEGSFYNEPKESDAPTILTRIQQAEIIEELPFEQLEHVIYYKRKMGREKDLHDIARIQAWQELS